MESRDLFRDNLCAVVGRMLDGADESLSKLAEKADGEENQKRYLLARDLALANREVIEKHFRSRFTSDFQKRTNKAKQIGQSLAEFSLDDLELVGDDDLDETLRFNKLAGRMRRHCEEALAALDQRVAVLMGDAALESDDNPFGPQVICDAYKHACRQVDCDVPVRRLFIELIDDGVLDALRAGYDEVNALLVENSILPKIRYGIAKQEGKTPLTVGEAEREKSAQAAGGEDMFARLAQMLGPGAGPGGGSPGTGPGMGVGGAPLVQGQELMGSLTRLQLGDLAALGEAAAELAPILAEAGNLKNVLHQLKGTSVGAGMGQMDSMTLNIVAMLFDELFEDPKIPIALKGLIGRLQLPLLKVAIADKELFTEKSHPARQLLDVLGQIGLRLPAEFDATSPLFARLEAFVQELVDGFKEKMEIFDKVRGDLEAIVAEDDQRVAREMQAAEEQLRQAESLAVAKAIAQEEIRARVEAAAQAPRPVIEFLAQHWIKYLVIAHARHGKDSGPWKQALETMDLLLWSVAPKAAADEQRQLAKSVPALLKGIKAGIAEAGIEDAVAQAFLGELMKCHTEVMRAPVAPAKKGEATPAKPSAAAATPAVPATKRQLPPPDDVLDFTAPVTVNNPFGEGKVEVSSEDLDFTASEAGEPAAPAELAPLPAAAAPSGAHSAGRPAKARQASVRLPTAMVVGAWVEVVTDNDGTRKAAKLHYVSPMKSHFLFVDRKGNKVYECSRTMLARRIKLGEVTMLKGEPDASLFDRIVEGIFGKLKGAKGAGGMAAALSGR